jgi:hypothetical protein
VNAICRAHGIAFFTARTFGMEGVVFCDLGESHAYRRTPMGDNTAATPSAPITVAFPSLEAAERVQWGTLQTTRKRGPQFPRVFVKSQRTFAVSGDNCDLYY